MFDWLINEFLGNVWNNIRTMIDFLARPFMDPLGVIKGLRSKSIPAAVRKTIVFLLVLTVVVTLGVLTWVLGLDRHASAGPWLFRKTWMGWLALLLYLIARLFVAVLRQLRVLSPALKSFPDIDRAMQAGLNAAADAGIAIDQIPLFLVTGLSRQAEQEFVKANAIGSDVCVDDESLCIHWYGDAGGIWLTIPGIAVTSAQSDLIAEAAERAIVEDSPFAALAVMEQAEAAGLAGGSGAGSGTDTLTVDLVTLRQQAREQAAATQPSKAELVSVKQRDEARDRLQYFCQVLKDARYPVCPINAVLLGLPFNESVLNERMAQSLRECVKTDMSVLQQHLGVRCLSAVLFTGCRDNPQLLSYTQKLPAETLARRCGVSFPQLVGLAEEDPERVHEWLQRDFELQAMHLFKIRPGDPSNEQLFQFVDSLRQARSYFCGMLRGGYTQPGEDVFYFSGVYIAELSAVNGTIQPFLDGVLTKVLNEHDELICWSEQSLKDDARAKRTSLALLAVATAVMALNIGLIWKMTMI